MEAPGHKAILAASGRLNNFWYEYNDSETVLVFVHGIFSDSHSCWLRQQAHVTSFWPDLVTKDPRLRQSSIYLAGYPTEFDSGDFPVAQCAREIIDALQRPEIDGQPPVLTFNRLVFICHSTGGIVVRYMLERYDELFADKAIGLALIASPSLGSGWATLASVAARYYNQRLGLQLRWNNAELEDIHWRFKDLVDQRSARMPGLFGREAAEHTLIYRDRIPRWIRWALPPRLKVVTTLSAGQYFGAVKILQGTNHFTAVKPDNVNHPAHLFLVDFAIAFGEFCEKAPVAPRPRFARTPALLASGIAPTPERAAIDNQPWPEKTRPESPVHGFLGEAGFRSQTELAVVAAVLVEDVSAFDRRFEIGVAEILQDPYFRALPALMTALRTREFGAAVDPDLRLRLADLVANLIFEAYVCFGRRQPDVDDEALYRKLTAKLLFQRLRAAGDRPLTLVLARSSGKRFDAVDLAVSESANHIKRADGHDVTAAVRAAERREPGAVVADYVSEVVLERLRFPGTIEARAFERIHPTKLRLMHDSDTGEFFSRKRPFGQ